MKIEKLELIHFGKFHHKEIVFDKEVTLIYGLNESGKTTVWHFILGMFFGFFKPYIKTRRYLDLHDKYQPWESSKYCGSMILDDEKMGRRIRIYRDFRQGEEAVTIHDEVTGEELTGLYDIHPVFRLPDIAKMHLNISYYGYVNMGAISQLGHETDEYLSIELKETVVNTLSSKTLNVSMQKIQNQLKAKKDQIGSRKKTSSVFAKTTEALEHLYQERQRVMDQEKNMQDAMEYQKQLEIDLKVLETQLKEIDAYNVYLQKRQEQDRFRRLKEIKNKQKQMDEKIVQIKRGTDYTLSDVYTAKERYQEKKRIESDLSKYEEAYQQNEVNVDKIRQEIKTNEKDIHELKTRNKVAMKVILSAGLGISLVMLIVFGLRQQWILTLIATVIAGLEIGMLILRQSKEQAYRQEIVQMELKNKTLYEQLEKMQDSINQISQSSRNDHQSLAALNEGLMPLMGLLEIENSHGFDQRIQEYQSIEQYQLEKIRLEEQEKNLLEGKSMVALLKELEDYDFDAMQDYLERLTEDDFLAIQKNKLDVIHEEQEKKYEYIKITTQIKENRKKYQSLADIDEQINACEIKLETYKHQLMVYQIIDDTLEAIASDLKYEFSPSMNQTLSSLLAKVTDGKYNQVKITPDMQILFYDPTTHKMQDISSLSRGTMDLFYILFRYTVAKWSQQSQVIPFVLDEVFAYIDDQRLEEMMDILIEFKEQVILFTCQEREKQLAAKKQIKIIEL